MLRIYRSLTFAFYSLPWLVVISGTILTFQLGDPGETLARKHCSSCHLFPEPDILTKRSWNYLLTDMGWRLGIVDYNPVAGVHPAALNHLTSRQQLLNRAGLIPGRPLISKQDWRSIRDYYAKKAPRKSLPQTGKPPINQGLKQFELLMAPFQPKGAVFTLNRVNPHHGGLILNNIRDQKLIVINKQLEVTDSFFENETIVDAMVNGDSLLMLAIGDLMGSHIGEGRGSLYLGDVSNSQPSRKLITGLHRPVDFEIADLDLDGHMEIIICNFGDVTGNVSIYNQEGLLVKELINAPGAIRSQVHDFNDDGHPDIAILMGDARENISLFINRGNHQYERKVVVECHSAYGHTYFELQDFNGDGHMDFLVTNGDTDADPYNTLKNYHGIRIYLNDGQNNFELQYFYPMYGAHFAKAADFDQDGDLDIAASAFFPDFSSDRPEQFVYLENAGKMNFKPFTHPETYGGRWMILDVGDYDLDGDQDIVLGGGYHSLGMVVDHQQKYQSLLEKGKALLIFENKLR